MSKDGGGPSPIGGDGGGGGGGNQPASNAARPPTPAEIQRWKALAEEAEEKVAALEERVAELEAALETARADAARALAEAEIGRAIERELTRAGAIDLEAAALLLEAPADAAGVPGAVRALRDRKPALFRPAPGAAGASMSPAAPDDELADLASAARRTGDRAALLRYLRRRRTA